MKIHKSEEACRRIYNYLVQQSFVNCRPTFLRGLELDGYCKKHELAFEYNGIQHYQFYRPFQRTVHHFERLQERDHLKNKLCKEYGLILMTIPYTYTFHQPIPMGNFIYQQLLKAEVNRNESYICYRCPTHLDIRSLLKP